MRSPAAAFFGADSATDGQFRGKDSNHYGEPLFVPAVSAVGPVVGPALVRRTGSTRKMSTVARCVVPTAVVVAATTSAAASFCRQGPRRER